jgi:hypothetical protein
MGPFLRTALSYLLAPEVATLLMTRPENQCVAFLKELIHKRDSDWEGFVPRYREACETTRRFGERLERSAAEAADRKSGLAAEIERELGEDPRQIPAQILGRVIEDGAWWQYLKELAFRHPAAVLFISRHVLGDAEILIPRYRADSPVVQALGLTGEEAAPA